MNDKIKELLKKDRYDFGDLCAVMEVLRGEGGCPWDREQTHESIRTDFLEETHEALEAINNGDAAALEEELGCPILTSPLTQYNGALGAALFAWQAATR